VKKLTKVKKQLLCASVAYRSSTSHPLAKELEKGKEKLMVKMCGGVRMLYAITFPMVSTKFDVMNREGQ